MPGVLSYVLNYKADKTRMTVTRFECSWASQILKTKEMSFRGRPSNASSSNSLVACLSAPVSVSYLMSSDTSMIKRSCPRCLGVGVFVRGEAEWMDGLLWGFCSAGSITLLSGIFSKILDQPNIIASPPNPPSLIHNLPARESS